MQHTFVCVLLPGKYAVRVGEKVVSESRKPNTPVATSARNGRGSVDSINAREYLRCFQKLDIIDNRIDSATPQSEDGEWPQLGQNRSSKAKNLKGTTTPVVTSANNTGGTVDSRDAGKRLPDFKQQDVVDSKAGSAPSGSNIEEVKELSSQLTQILKRPVTNQPALPKTNENTPEKLIGKNKVVERTPKKTPKSRLAEFAESYTKNVGKKYIDALDADSIQLLKKVSKVISHNSWRSTVLSQE